MIPILLRTLQIFKMILTMKKILHDFTRTYQPSPPPPSPETTFSYCLYLRNKSCNLGARLPKVTFRYQCFINKSNLIKSGRAGLSRIELMSLYYITFSSQTKLDFFNLNIAAPIWSSSRKAVHRTRVRTYRSEFSSTRESGLLSTSIYYLSRISFFYYHPLKT